MTEHAVVINPCKRIALVAHDNKKADLLDWVRFNRALLAEHELFATGTTGTLLEEELQIPVIKLQSGPLGGRPADWRQDRRRSNRLSDLLLGSA